MKELEEEIGKDMDDWKWGRIHQLTFEHVLGKKKPLDRIFNLGPYPVGGSGLTVNKKQYPRENPYNANHGVSMRMIVDFSNMDASWHVLPTGGFMIGMQGQAMKTERLAKSNNSVGLCSIKTFGHKRSAYGGLSATKSICNPINLLTNLFEITFFYSLCSAISFLRHSIQGNIETIKIFSFQQLFDNPIILQAEPI